MKLVISLCYLMHSTCDRNRALLDHSLWYGTIANLHIPSCRRARRLVHAAQGPATTSKARAQLFFSLSKGQQSSYQG
jgi:hypothetical protein